MCAIDKLCKPTLYGIADICVLLINYVNQLYRDCGYMCAIDKLCKPTLQEITDICAPLINYVNLLPGDMKLDIPYNN